MVLEWLRSLIGKVSGLILVLQPLYLRQKGLHVLSESIAIAFHEDCQHNSLQGEEFDSAALLTAEALCELRSAHAITGLIAWCEQVSGQKFTWMNGTMMKAKGW